MKNIPALDPKVLGLVTEISKEPKVEAAIAFIKDQTEVAMLEQIELCEIEAPTFHEEKRAASVAERMRQYGLTDVHIDEIGNVIGIRKGSGNGPVLAIGAHMDSVFPAGTDVKVKKEGNIYRAPGIGDNCSGLRALLQVLRALEKEDIRTVGDIWFVGTVGEEGNGDIRGSKHLCANNKLDGFVAIDSTDVGRVLYGAVGSHRLAFSRGTVQADTLSLTSARLRAPFTPFAVAGPISLPTSKFRKTPRPPSRLVRSRAVRRSTRFPLTAKWTWISAVFPMMNCFA